MPLTERLTQLLHERCQEKGTLHHWAGLYRKACAEANQRLADCGKLVARHRYREAWELAQREPELLSQAELLQFPEREQWQRHARKHGAPSAPDLQLDQVRRLREAFVRHNLVPLVPSSAPPPIRPARWNPFTSAFPFPPRLSPRQQAGLLTGGAALGIILLMVLVGWAFRSPEGPVANAASAQPDIDSTIEQSRELDSDSGSSAGSGSSAPDAENGKRDSDAPIQPVIRPATDSAATPPPPTVFPPFPEPPPAPEPPSHASRPIPRSSEILSWLREPIPEIRLQSRFAPEGNDWRKEITLLSLPGEVTLHDAGVIGAIPGWHSTFTISRDRSSGGRVWHLHTEGTVNIPLATLRCSPAPAGTSISFQWDHDARNCSEVSHKLRYAAIRLATSRGTLWVPTTPPQAATSMTTNVLYGRTTSTIANEYLPVKYKVERVDIVPLHNQERFSLSHTPQWEKLALPATATSKVLLQTSLEIEFRPSQRSFLNFSNTLMFEREPDMRRTINLKKQWEGMTAEYERLLALREEQREELQRAQEAYKTAVYASASDFNPDSANIDRLEALLFIARAELEKTQAGIDKIYRLMPPVLRDEGARAIVRKIWQEGDQGKIRIDASIYRVVKTQEGGRTLRLAIPIHVFGKARPFIEELPDDPAL